MESLSLESKTIYKLLMADSKEEYERRFLDNKKEVLNALQPFVIYTKAQLNSVNVVFIDIKASVGADLEEARSQIGGELDSVHKSLHAEITQLVVEIGRLPRPDPGALVGNGSTPVHREPGASSAGLIGHSCDHNDRVHCVFTTRFLRSELPQFEGSNPKLRQRRCEDFFQRRHTLSADWVSQASDQFVGAVATWMETHM